MGQKAFETRCGVCHGGDGGGGEMGPPLAQRLRRLGDPELIKVIHDGIPTKGMPPNLVKGPELTALVKFLRVIALRVSDTPIVRKTVQTTAARRSKGRSSAKASRTCNCGPATRRSICCAAPETQVPPTPVLAARAPRAPAPQTRRLAASASGPSPPRRPGRPTTAMRAATATRRSRRSTSRRSAVSRPPGSSPSPIPARCR